MPAASVESPDTSLVIRRASAGDGEAIAELFVLVNRELAPPAMAKEFEAYIELSLDQEIRPFLEYYDPALGNGLWVALESGELAGMYGLERVSIDEVELRRMYVAPEHRRKGLARTMLRHAEAEAAEQGYTRMILSTAEVQQAAIALYGAEGFRFVRREEAQTQSNKTVGGGIVRLHFDKNLRAPR
jgi:putative acetyltransferase